MKEMMAQKAPFHANLKRLSEKAPEIAWQVERGGKALPNWTTCEQAEEVCFALGIANGLDAPLEGDHHLVLLDWEVEHMNALLESEEASKLLSSPNVHFSLLDKEESYLLLQGLFSGLSAEVKIHPIYEKDPKALSAAMRLISDSKAVYWAHDELLHYPHKAALHILENLDALPYSINGSALFGKFQKVPAIICGAGPSLDKALPLLPWLKDHALIFAPGSSLNALSSCGCVPHFSAGLDPYHAQYERIMMQSAFEVPFFYTGRWLPTARSCYSGPLLYVGGCENPLSQWIDQELGMGKGPVLEGPGVVPFSTELARLMGCDPIIYVGMDLAYTEDRLYGSGVGDMRKVKDLEGLIHHKGLLTEWKWVEEANWLSNYAKTHPQKTFLNATGGGLGLGTILEKPLEQIQWKSSLIPLEEWIKKDIQKGFPLEVLAKGQGLKERFWVSLDRCLDLLKKMKGSVGGMQALYEVEFQEEIAYQAYLSWPEIALKSKMARGQEVDKEALFTKLLTLMKDAK